MKKTTNNFRFIQLSMMLVLSLMCGQTKAQIITTIAGNGTMGYTGDGGQATAAELGGPQGAVVLNSGNVYVSDVTTSTVRKINPAGIITTVAGNGTAGYSGDGLAATNAELSAPDHICFDASGNLYIADFNNEVIRKVDATTGIINTIAGGGASLADGIPATDAVIEPAGLLFDGAGNLIFCDDAHNKVREISPSGYITTIAGTGTPGFSGDGGPASAAELWHTLGICMDGSGNIYFSDSYSRIRKITAHSGVIDGSCTINTFAGTGTAGYSGDGGSALVAEINVPLFLAADGAGDIYVSDQMNNRIRKIDGSGIITTVVGTGVGGDSGDGGPATAAEITNPMGIDVDCAGDIYIADFENYKVRKVTMANHPPVFLLGDTASLTVCEDASAVSINAFLNANDPDVGQKETWAVYTPAIEGTVTGSYSTTATTGTITPTGFTYTPHPGFTGLDQFQIIINDCADGYAVITINVTVNPVPASITGASAVCAGSGATLADAVSGGVWSSSDISIATAGSTGIVTGVSAGTTTISYLLGGCPPATASFTVNPLPATITGTTNVCLGATSTLSDGSTGGTWSSSNISVAKVNAGTGIVTGLSVGTATITYTLPTGCYVTTPVTVSIPSGITGTATVCVGLTTTLSDATSGGVWSSSDIATATVGSGTGVVTGVAVGTATITYTLFAGCITTTTVSVTSPPAITGTTSVCAGLTTALSNTETGGTWSSSNTAVATTGSGSGIVTGVSAGTATISYTLPTGCYVTAGVTVVAASAITGTTNVCLGLITTLSDGGGGTWSSSDITTAAIGSTTGVVTGVAVGTATITYTLPLGCIATTTVTVNPLPDAITGGETDCPGYTFTLSDATTGGIWSSSNTAIATIGSATGVVTTVSGGAATITYTLPTGCIATKAVSVNPFPTPIYGIPYICMGYTTTLEDGTWGGVWSSDNTAIATIGSTSGDVTTISVGTTTITYTLATGCYVTATVAPVPPITGLHEVCAWGGTMDISDAETGGLYTSSLATVTNLGGGNALVTAYAPGTATVTYIIPTGCSVTSDVTINPLPAPVFGITLLCAGSTMTLIESPTGGVWVSGTPAVATIGSASGIVTSVSAGTTTITYTLPTGCFVDTSIAVSPPPAGITGTTSMCIGGTATLSDPAGGGTWASSSTAIATVGSAGIVTGVAPGTATIYYTLPGGCYTTITVTVDGPPAAIGGAGQVCEGGTITLTDGTPDGTWGSSDLTVATIGLTTGLLTGTAVTTNTVTVTYIDPEGCTTTTVITVNANSDPCSPCIMGASYEPLGLSGEISGNVGAGNYYIANDVWITGSDTFTNAVIQIAPGKTLNLDHVGSLLLNGCHLFGQCQMWQGIVLQYTPTTPKSLFSAKLTITGGTLIEDAVTAVYAYYPAAPAWDGPYDLLCDNAIFNRNLTSIDIENCPVVESGGTYPFLIRNTVVTSRDFQTAMGGSYPHHWPTTANLKGAWAAPDVFTPPFNIYNPAGAPTGGAYNWIACKNGSAPYIAVKLDSVGGNTLNPALTSLYGIAIPATYSEIVVGDATAIAYQNMFDAQEFGIYALNSNVSSVNNVFTGMYAVGTPTYPAGSIVTGGDGVYAAETNDALNKNRLQVYSPGGTTFNNLFYGFRNGIECGNYFHLKVQQNNMFNSGPGTGLLFSYGDYGVTLKTAKYDTVDISFNTINNVNTGIAMWATGDPFSMPISGPPNYAQFVGAGNITGNVIQANPGGYGEITTQNIKNAISLQSILSYSSVPPYNVRVMTGSQMNVWSNQLNDVYNGININNWWKQPANSEANYVKVRPSTASPKWLQSGINYTNCYGGTVLSNNVTGSGTPAPVAGVNSDSLRAFYASGNTKLSMWCNTENYLGRGYEFTLTNALTSWFDNNMILNHKGMVLNGGVIGAQHPSGMTMNNSWLGAWGSGDTQTYVYHGANASTSPFYVYTSSSVTNPNVNSGDPFNPTRDYFNGPSSNIHSSSGAIDCPVYYSPVLSDTGNLYEQIAQQQVAYTTNIIPSNWMGQYALWKAILMDSTLTDSSATLAVFASLAVNSRYKYLTDIENLLADGDFTDATTMLGYSIDPMANTSWDSVTQVQMADTTAADNIVENYQNFFSLYMKYETVSLSSSDSLAIMALAQLCPQRNGNVVFQARALYSEMYNDLNIFNDDSCLDVDTSYIADRHNPMPIVQHANEEQKYSVYPNPNDGSFVIQQYIPDNEPVQTKIYDAVGRTIYTNELQFANTKSMLNLNSLVPGMYVLEITDSKNRIFRFKFVIDK